MFKLIEYYNAGRKLFEDHTSQFSFDSIPEKKATIKRLVTEHNNTSPLHSDKLINGYVDAAEEKLRKIREEIVLMPSTVIEANRKPQRNLRRVDLQYYESWIEKMFKSVSKAARQHRVRLNKSKS